MIFGIPSLAYVLIMLCAFVAGCAGTGCTMLIALALRKKSAKKKESERRINRAQVSDWQRNAQDEQLYNGR